MLLSSPASEETPRILSITTSGGSIIEIDFEERDEDQDHGDCENEFDDDIVNDNCNDGLEFTSRDSLPSCDTVLSVSCRRVAAVDDDVVLVKNEKIAEVVDIGLLPVSLSLITLDPTFFLKGIKFLLQSCLHIGHAEDFCINQGSMRASGRVIE